MLCLKISNGVLIQFGKSTALGWRTIAFPTSFSIAPVIAICNNNNDSPNPNIISEVVNHTSTTCDFGINDGSYVLTILWIAIGY